MELRNCTEFINRDGASAIKNKYLPDYTIDIYLEQVEKQFSPLNRNSKCYDDIQYIRNTSGIYDTLKDAWGAPPGLSGQLLATKEDGSYGLSGFVQGNRVSFGSRFQCETAGGDFFETRYCQTRYDIFDAWNKGGLYPRSDRVQGVCLPSSCVDQFLRTWKLFPDEFYYKQPPGIGSFEECSLHPVLRCDPAPSTFWDRCSAETNGDPESSSWCWTGLGIWLAIFSIVGISTLAAMIYRGWQTRSDDSTAKSKKQPNLPTYFLFSLQASWEALTDMTYNPKHFNTLNAMRVLALVWVIQGHCFNEGWHPSYTGEHLLVVKNIKWVFKEWFDRWWFHLLASAEPAVDTFFTMGGFLAGQIVYKKYLALQKGKTSQEYRVWKTLVYALSLMIHRWLRFAPIIMFTVSFYWIVPAFKNDVMSAVYEQWVGSCYNNDNGYTWYSVLFFYQTWTDVVGCMGHFWYIADEFWYYAWLCIIMVFFALPERRWNRITLPASAITTQKTLFQLIGYGSMIFMILFPPCWKVYWSYRPEEGKDLYFRPESRFSAYFIGALAGYTLLNKRTLLNPKRWWHFVMYCCSWIMLVTLMVVFMGLQRKELENNFASPGTKAWYLGWKREIWAVLVVWNIILLEFVRPFVNNFPVNFMTSKFWYIPARLNYSVYAIHFLMIGLVMGFWAEPQTWTFSTYVTTVVMTTIYSNLWGLMAFLTVEVPFAKLAEICFNQPVRRLLS